LSEELLAQVRDLGSCRRIRDLAIGRDRRRTFAPDRAQLR